jgi:hypothetical protein
MGVNYLTNVLDRAVDRLRGSRADSTPISDVAFRDALAESLAADLKRGDAQSAEAVAAVLEAVGGMQTALEAATEAAADEVQEALVNAFAELGRSFAEFSSTQRDMQETRRCC